MNPQELSARLSSMNASERAKFIGAVGMPGYSDDMVMDHFVKEAAWEKKICHVLNEPTEADKAVQATLQQAADQRRSVIVAWVALAVAVVLGSASLIVSIIAISR